MTTVTIYPGSAGDLTEWATQYPASGSHWEKVKETVKDDDTTYLQTTDSSAYKTDIFKLTAFAAVGGKINSITVHNWQRVTVSPEWVYYYTTIKTGGSLYYSPLVSSATAPATYTDTSYTWSTNPHTGVAWTWADIATLQIGLKLKAGSGGTHRWTQCYVVVDYTPTPGGANVFCGSTGCFF